MGLELVENDLPFDVWSDGAIPNTEVRFCRRDGLQDKVFARTTLRRVLYRQDTAELAAALGSSRLDACAAGLDVATSLASCEVEMVAVVSSFETASSGAIGLPDVVECLRFAATAPSTSGVAGGAALSDANTLNENGGCCLKVAPDDRGCCHLTMALSFCRIAGPDAPAG